MRLPRTADEMQEAANEALWLTAVDSARQYGLVETDLKIDVERCCVVLEWCRKHGIAPNKSLEDLTAKYVAAAMKG